MDWKTELVRKINALKDGDFRDGKAEIVVHYLMPWDGHIAIFAAAFNCVNSHPVAWVGPGYLMLKGGGSVRTAEDMADGTLVFELSRDRKFNAFIIEDVFTGQFGKLELPIHDEIDFLSL